MLAVMVGRIAVRRLSSIQNYSTLINLINLNLSIAYIDLHDLILFEKCGSEMSKAFFIHGVTTTMAFLIPNWF